MELDELIFLFFCFIWFFFISYILHTLFRYRIKPFHLHNSPNHKFNHNVKNFLIFHHHEYFLFFSSVLFIILHFSHLRHTVDGVSILNLGSMSSLHLHLFFLLFFSPSNAFHSIATVLRTTIKTSTIDSFSSYRSHFNNQMGTSASMLQLIADSIQCSDFQ